MEQKFLVCKHCGNMVAVVKETGVPILCCGEPMGQMLPGTTDASQEKHVPVYTVEGTTVKVTVGAAPHPMTEEHYIEWISLQTKHGNQRKVLSLDKPAGCCFHICENDEVQAVYAYCNLHGLWKA